MVYYKVSFGRAVGDNCNSKALQETEGKERRGRDNLVSGRNSHLEDNIGWKEAKRNHSRGYSSGTSDCRLCQVLCFDNGVLERRGARQRPYTNLAISRHGTGTCIEDGKKIMARNWRSHELAGRNNKSTLPKVQKYGRQRVEWGNQQASRGAKSRREQATKLQ